MVHGIEMWCGVGASVCVSSTVNRDVVYQERKAKNNDNNKRKKKLLTYPSCCLCYSVRRSCHLSSTPPLLLFRPYTLFIAKATAIQQHSE